MQEHLSLLSEEKTQANPIFWDRVWKVAAVAFSVLFLYFLFFLNHIGGQEIGISYSSWDGKVVIQDKVGWYVTGPLTRVAKLPTTPVQVCTHAGRKVISCKTVRFKKEGVQEFLDLEGFSYNKSIVAVFTKYAFTSKNYAFLEVLEELAPVKR